MNPNAAEYRQSATNGGYITYNVPQPIQKPQEPSYPELSTQPTFLQQYIREHALKYVQPAPDASDNNEAYNQWIDRLHKIEKKVYDKYMKKWSNAEVQKQQKQQLSPIPSENSVGSTPKALTDCSSSRSSDSSSSDSSNGSNASNSSEIEADYEHLKRKYNELVRSQKSINDIQSKFMELEKYNKILLEQQSQSVTFNALQQKILELEEANKIKNELISKLYEEKRCLKLENVNLNQLNITIEAQHEQYENAKLMMQLEFIKYQQKYENLEKKYDELVLKKELIDIKYADLEKKQQKQQKDVDEKNAVFTKWNTKEIVNWIIALNKDKYGKYRDILTTNMNKEGIDGLCLNDLDKTDLYRLGITQFKDKKDIYQKIRVLCENNTDFDVNNGELSDSV